jgi:porin-like protein
MQRKTKLAVAVGAALLAAGTTAQAQVTGAQTGINVQLYGQVSRAVMHADDGFNSKWFHVDGQPSSTRFGINASAPITPGLRMGARIETEMKSNPSNVVSFGATAPNTPSTGALNITTAPPTAAVAWVERWLSAYVEGGFGRIDMGQGSGAADDVSTLDLSGTNMPNGTCPTDWGGGIPFVSSATGLPVTGGLGTATGLGDCNDFESRYDRLQYTTPTFGGFRAQFSNGQRTAAAEANEASIWYTGKLAGDLQAAVGWSRQNSSTPAGVPDRETFGGGVAWLSAAGFNIAANYTEVKGVAQVAGNDRKGKTTWLKVGYKFGQHAVALDYGMYDDIAAAGDEGKSIGAGYTWAPTRWAEIYAGYHLFTLDRPGVSLEDVTVFAIGTRVRF